MKYRLLILIAIINLTVLTGQNLSGEYRDDSGLLTFWSDSAVSFDILGQTTREKLPIRIKGQGNYRIIKNYLVIQTKDYPEQTPLLLKSCKNTGHTTITVVDKEDEAIPFVSCVQYSKEEIIGSSAAGFDGRLNIPDTAADSIHLSFVGFVARGIPIEHNCEYRVELVDYKILEYKTVIFKIVDLKEDYITVKLCNYDNYIPDYDMKRIKRLVRKSFWRNDPPKEVFYKSGKAKKDLKTSG